MGKDNTTRYRRFSEAIHLSILQAKKALDEEWNTRWKKCKDDTAFEARLEELKSKRKKTSIFHSFNQSKKAKLSFGKLKLCCFGKDLSKLE